MDVWRKSETCQELFPVLSIDSNRDMDGTIFQKNPLQTFNDKEIERRRHWAVRTIGRRVEDSPGYWLIWFNPFNARLGCVQVCVAFSFYRLEIAHDLRLIAKSGLACMCDVRINDLRCCLHRSAVYKSIYILRNAYQRVPCQTIYSGVSTKCTCMYIDASCIVWSMKTA